MRTSPEFVFAKNLPIERRLGLIGALAVIGVLLQLFFSLFVGWLLVLLAVLLGTTKSVSNQPDSLRGGEWQNVTLEELEKARRLISDAEKIKSQAWSCSSAIGCFGAAFTLLCIGVVTVMIAVVADRGMPEYRITQPIFRGGSLGLLFAIDSLTLFAPMWFFGRVKAWEPPFIRLRLEQLMHIYRNASSNPKLDFQPSLQVAKTSEGLVPIDCKLMVNIKDSDPAFMGIQIQTSINDVQGTKYPYTYCVLIARPEFGLISKAREVVELSPRNGFPVGFFADANEKKERKFARFRNALVELKKEGDIEIAVVRQKTSGTGYKTSPEQAQEIFNAAYQLALAVLRI